jgi:uncharacterized repeat protein (TIGR04052 family)
MDVTIRFEARVADRPFRCGERYAGLGATRVEVEPSDLRFFVQDLSLIDEAGKRVPVELTERTPWQTASVALLDFEDGTGACTHGTSDRNDHIEGRVPVGVYRGLWFRNGVPETLNHEDPLRHPAPLQVTDLTWGWLTGFKFFVAELRQVASRDDDAGPANGFGLLHVGSSACNPAGRTTVCRHPNRNEIQLDRFDVEHDRLVVDIAALFADADLTVDAQCHSNVEAICKPLFAKLGVDWDTGASLPTQQVFRVE